jgi:hypothetical protein
MKRSPYAWGGQAGGGMRWVPGLRPPRRSCRYEIGVRQSRMAKPDSSAPSGVTEIEPFFAGPTAKEYELEKPCYQ